MRQTDDAADESAAVLTAALVIALFGTLAVIETGNGAVTWILLVLASAAAVGGLLRRYADKK